MNAARSPSTSSPDAELGLKELAPSPDAQNSVALRRLIAPVLVGGLGVGALLVFMKDLPPLPAFSGAAQVAGAPAGPGPVAVRLDTTLAITLTPKGDLGGPVEGTAYVEEAGAVRRLLVRPTVSEAGVVALQGAVGEALGVRRGPVQVILLVTRPGGQPETAADVLRDGPWYAHRVALQVSE